MAGSVINLRLNPGSIAFAGAFFNSSTFTVLGIIGIVLLFIMASLAGTFRGTLLGKLLSSLTGFMFIIGIIVVILWILLLNPHVGMTRTGFATNNVFIFSGNKITFQNPSDGVTQILCIGSNRHCEPADSADGPSQLGHGLVIRPGQSVSIRFNGGGNYYITSENTPNMNLIVYIAEDDDTAGDS